MNIVKPRLGSIVLFKHSEHVTFPAIVTRVHESVNANEFPFVDLIVFTSFVCEAFTAIQPGDTVLTWSWPDNSNLKNI